MRGHYGNYSRIGTDGADARAPDGAGSTLATEPTWGKWVTWALGGAAVVGVGLMAWNANKSLKNLSKP